VTFVGSSERIRNRVMCVDCNFILRCLAHNSQFQILVGSYTTINLLSGCQSNSSQTEIISTQEKSLCVDVGNVQSTQYIVSKFRGATPVS
jgi:hypothetical protein